TVTKVVYVDDRLYMTGYIRNNISGKDEMIVLKYKLDGTLDATFSSDGWIAQRAQNQTYSAYGNSIAIELNGKIIVGGMMGSMGATPNYPVLMRLKTNGALDINYGDGGFAEFSGATGSVLDILDVASIGTVYGGFTHDSETGDFTPVIGVMW
ncbi:MAG TPA: hypothetical protein VJC18_04565, partial [bacterium]|nr:hypothetical protein [bacterium]